MCSTILPVSNGPLYGVLHIREKDPKPLTWEFSVKDAKELKKLPGYPITHKVKPEGIKIVIKNGNLWCNAAFHGYDEHSRFGKNFYIGAARRLLGPKATEEYKDFLTKVFSIKVGIDTNPINVKLDFHTNNTIIVSPIGSQ